MALPVIENVFRCAVRQNIAGKSLVNVMHIETSAPATATDVADAMAEAWGEDTGMCLVQSTSVDLLGVDCTPLDGITPTVSVGFGGAENDNGKHSAFPMPAGDALCLSLKSATRGRSSNGRAFIGGLCSNQMETLQQSWSSGTLTAVSDAYTSMVAYINTALSGAAFVVASYKLEEAYPIVSASPKSRVASQRRRDG